jgi:hypothetical protein
MVTKTNAKAAHNIPDLPAEWADAEVLAGLALVEKEELVDRLFLVRAVQQTFSSQEYAMVRVEIEFTDGTGAMFQDSSAKSGVRSEVEEILKKAGKADVLDEWVPVRFICPQGLRISRYEKEDQRGQMRPARSFYFPLGQARRRLTHMNGWSVPRSSS